MKIKDKLYAKNTLGLTSASFGHCIFISLTSMALPMFFTDVMLISPATVALIFLLTRIWDAVNDPMMGALVDRTRTRWGKCRPYLLYGAVPLLVMTVLMFMPVDIKSSGGKFAYAFLTYMFFITAFTAIDIPLSGMKPLMFTDPTKRNKATSFASTFGSLGSLLAIDLFFAMVVVFGQGNDKKGYFVTVLILAILAFIALLTGFFTTKEVVPFSNKKISLKATFKAVAKNKFLMIAIVTSVCSIAISAYGILLPYFSKWNLADSFSFGAFSVESVLIPVLSTVTGVIYMVAVMVTPFLLKYITKKNLFIISSVMGVVLNTVSCVCGYDNLFVFMAIRFLAHIPTTITATIAGYMIMDSMDYAEYKTGERTEGTSFAFNNFIMKTGNAVFSALIMFLLGIAGYNAALSEPALGIGESIRFNYPDMLNGIFIMMTVLPAIGCFIQIFPMLFYKLSDKMVLDISKELQERRDSADGENTLENAADEGLAPALDTGVNVFGIGLENTSDAPESVLEKYETSHNVSETALNVAETADINTDTVENEANTTESIQEKLDTEEDEK